MAFNESCWNILIAIKRPDRTFQCVIKFINFEHGFHYGDMHLKVDVFAGIARLLSC